MKELILYENDLKYKSHRNIPEDEFKKLQRRFKNSNDVDSIQYRMKECEEKNGEEHLDLSHIGLSDLPNRLPITLRELFISDNNLKSLDNLSYLVNLEVLDCCSNRLTILDGNLPETLVEITCRNNFIGDIYGIRRCKKLEKIDCSHNRIKKIDSLSTVRILICSNNQLRELPESTNLEKLECAKNRIEKIPKYPKLSELDCSHNQIAEISDFPLLENLYCNHNLVERLHGLDSIEILHCHSNRLKKIDHFPTLIELMTDYNDEIEIAIGYARAEKTIFNKNKIFFNMENI